jgi:hypothetical protein
MRLKRYGYFKENNEFEEEFSDSQNKTNAFDVEMDMTEEDGDTYIGSKLMKDLSKQLGVEVSSDGSINYEGKKINFYSETEKFHVDKKKFATVEEVLSYLGVEDGVLVENMNDEWSDDWSGSEEDDWSGEDDWSDDWSGEDDWSGSEEDDWSGSEEDDWSGEDDWSDDYRQRGRGDDDCYTCDDEDEEDEFQDPVVMESRFIKRFNNFK